MSIPSGRAAVLLFLFLAACTQTPPVKRAATPRGPTVARPLEVYQQLGFIAGPQDFPVVASFATLAGPHDSTYVVIALSLPNAALRFQRDSTGFVGQYHIVASFLRDSTVVKHIDRTENVHVGTFPETNRTDESIIFQDFVALAPGKYKVQLQSSDANSSRGFRARDSVNVPSYSSTLKLSMPVFVYEAGGRESVASRPDFIVNARKTVPYGAEPPRVYIELYGASTPQDVQLRVVDDGGHSVWQSQTTVTKGDTLIRYALVDVPTASLPLGKLWLEASTAKATAELIRSPLLVTISDQWLAANFDDVLRFVNYIATKTELDSLRTTTGEARRDLWERFWARRDPIPATPLNEYREEFFNRVRFATEHFGEPGRQGWDTSRGEVYIVLGPPGDVADKQFGSDAGGLRNALEWYYYTLATGRLRLTFVESGAGHYELTPESEQSFRTAALRARPRGK